MDNKNDAATLSPRAEAHSDAEFLYWVKNVLNHLGDEPIEVTFSFMEIPTVPDADGFICPIMRKIWHE